MRVLFGAAEVAPIFKRGGLGDVAGSLPPALRRLGVDIRIVMPWYPQIDTARFGIEERDGYGEMRLVDHEIPVYLICKEAFAKAFTGRDQLELNDEERLYEVFGAEIIRFISQQEWKPEVFHGNDWHVSRALALLEIAIGSELRDWGYGDQNNLATLFTIHNLGYFWTSLRQAVLTADIINTVSPSYAQEILTPEFCAELCHELTQRREDLFGVLNGIDYEIWNPQVDQFLARQYEPTNWQEGKDEDRKKLMEELGFTDANGMLVGFVGRIDPKQKGIEVLTNAVPRFSEMGVKVAVLGTGDAEFEEKLRVLSQQYSETVKVIIQYDEGLAHRIYAGCHALLVPSRYEPCGLIQMIAMKYGTLPIAHAVGGLKDTILDGGTGFLYQEYGSEGLVEAILRAKQIFDSNQAKWNQMVGEAMGLDYSWDSSAREYVKLYEKAMEKSRK